MKIPLTDIKIGERQRLDIGDLSDLESMSDPEVGQINPIIIDHDNRLITGRRRLAKATALGWDSIWAEYSESAKTELAKQKIEFFEDIGRKDRSWAEKCVAICKLHGLITIEKGEEGQGWTERQMATFTGIGKSSINYMLRVGAEILRDPKGEVANASDYVAAFKILVGRQRDLVHQEMERRRQANAATIVTQTDGQEDGPGEEESDPLHAQSLDMSPVEIRLRGFNKLMDTKGEQHSLAVLWKAEPDILSPLRYRLTAGGVAVLFIHNPGMLDTWRAEAENAGFICQPYPLVWHDPMRQHRGPEVFPFRMDYSVGLVLFKEKPKFETRDSSFISASSDASGLLPTAVHNHILTALSLDGDTVLLPCGANPVAVAECGRVPVFYEPDLALFQEKQNELECWYIDNVPNAKVVK